MFEERKVLPLSPVPLYMQIKEILRGRILDGSYAPMQQMPSESELMTAFRVSRITVRQALGDLEKEGLLFKVQGKGSFVAQPKAFQNLARLQGFGESMARMGYETLSRVLGIASLTPEKYIAAKLGLAEGEEVGELRRVRLLNRVPVSLDVSYMARHLGQRLQNEDLGRRDIFVILENDYGYDLGKAELQIEAVLADARLAEPLGTAEGSPVLRIERLTYTKDRQPVIFEYLYYRGDTFQYRLTVERRASTR